MPDFWEFPTVSMGLGPINAIYQARFNRYLHNRGIKDTSHQRVWAFLGDGEMDEPESLGAIGVAAREGLDNLTFVVNCNLQRLDGPVRGNGKIIQELEAFFRGAGWNVIKVIWGREWDPLLGADTDGALVDLMNTTPDGDFQTYKAESGAFVREHFFGRDPRTRAMVEDLTDAEIWGLKRGGHDYRKLYAAYARPRAPGPADGHPGQDHQGMDARLPLREPQLHPSDEEAHPRGPQDFRDRLQIPTPRRQLDEEPPALLPARGRLTRDGVPARAPAPPRRIPARDRPPASARPLDLPGRRGVRGRRTRHRAARSRHHHGVRPAAQGPHEGPRDRAPVRADHPRRGPHLRPRRPVPLQEDLLPARAELPLGGPGTDAQLPGGHPGVLLHEGITEAGSAASWTAAGTSYATHGEPMIPIYIFYSMFGFQRTGDQLWAAADQMTRGFLLGATAGRTTLNGEGLQHQDGHSLLLASTNPACVAYDAAFAFELGHIVRDGLRRMYGEPAPGEDQNVFYYLTLYNEPIAQPAEPDDVDVDGILAGMHRYSPAATDRRAPARRSWPPASPCPGRSRRRRSARRLGGERRRLVGHLVDPVAPRGPRHRRVEPPAPRRTAHEPPTSPPAPRTARAGGRRLGLDAGSPRPDRAVRPGDWSSLGTDGFGLSDTRAALRRHFGVDAPSIALRVVERLAHQRLIDPVMARAVARRYRLEFGIPS